MSRVAVATCLGVDVDPDSPLLLFELEVLGLKGELCVWDDPRVEWEHYDLVVIRSTWDYPSRRAEFLAWARGIAHLHNPYGVIEYSSDKHYLTDLLAHGLRIIPSHFCDIGKKPRFFDHDFVVKPCVGAGSMDAASYTKDEHELARTHVARLHAQGRDVLVQPYVESVDSIGERALIFINGEFSHAMTKGPMLNVDELDRHSLFRREQMSLAEAEPEAIAYATSVLAAKGFSHLLYARVDLVLIDNEWTVMEVELVEPSLFFTYYELAAERLAHAIAQRLH